MPSILLTALVTVPVTLPVAFDSENPGREFIGSMATGIIGGLVSATVLNLLLLPEIWAV